MPSKSQGTWKKKIICKELFICFSLTLTLATNCGEKSSEIQDFWVWDPGKEELCGQDKDNSQGKIQL